MGSHSLSPGDLPNPRVEPRSLTLQEPAWKPKNTGVCSLSLFQQIFPTQKLNQGLLHCRSIPYQLSYKGRCVKGGLLQWPPVMSSSCCSHFNVISLTSVWVEPSNIFLTNRIWQRLWIKKIATSILLADYLSDCVFAETSCYVEEAYMARNWG